MIIECNLNSNSSFVQEFCRLMKQWINFIDVSEGITEFTKLKKILMRIASAKNKMFLGFECGMAFGIAVSEEHTFWRHCYCWRCWEKILSLNYRNSSLLKILRSFGSRMAHHHTIVRNFLDVTFVDGRRTEDWPPKSYDIKSTYIHFKPYLCGVFFSISRWELKNAFQKFDFF